MQEIIGLWTYALLLRRPALSILFYTFRFLEEKGTGVQNKRRIPESVIEKLSALLDIFLLLCADLRLLLAQRIYFSDACPSGAGVQYADLTPREVWSFKDNVSETRARKGWHSTLMSCQSHEGSELLYTSPSPAVMRRPLKVSMRFERAIMRLESKTAVAHRWRWDGHINHLETDAQLLAVRHMASCPETRGHRVLALMDNTSTLGAVAKGRSSSFALNTTCRKIASVLLDHNISQIAHWVPTALNLADEPSRSLENVSKKRSPH